VRLESSLAAGYPGYQENGPPQVVRYSTAEPMDGPYLALLLPSTKLFSGSLVPEVSRGLTMIIFIGSSKEQMDTAVQLAAWLEAKGHEPLIWDRPGLFSIGTYVFHKLMDIANRVDLAILVFGDDDRVWYREDKMSQPRDNILLEYGLFSGVLGTERTLICRTNKSKVPTDLNGLIRIELSDFSENRVRQEIYAWINHQPKREQDPVKSDLERSVYSLQKQVDELKDRLEFKEQAVRDLISDKQGEIKGGSEWSQLFSYDYFWVSVNLICDNVASISELREFFNKAALGHVTQLVEFDQMENFQRLPFYTAKLLRVLRTNYPNDFFLFIQALDELR
jgi:predicted nucleotide-binding protein